MAAVGRLHHECQDDGTGREGSVFVSVLMMIALAVSACSCNPGASRQHLDVRNGHALTFDEIAERVVLFGGADASQVSGDTWSWDSQRRRWDLLTDGGPPARTFPSMAYDARRREVVLFGGNRVLFGTDGQFDTFLDDTWTLNGSVWTRRSVPGPSARAEAAVAYDRGRGRIVVFGGYRGTANGTLRLGDTWEWDGSRWEQMATDGPAARNGAALAYDEARQISILFGGSGASNETWEWDGKVWTRRLTTDVPGRFNPAMVYDAGLSILLRFGGWTGKERVGDTWTLGAGRDWSMLDTAGPAARNHASMAYDRARHAVVLFGGHDGDRVFGDTWEWNGRDWTLVGDYAPQMRVNNGH